MFYAGFNPGGINTWWKVPGWKFYAFHYLSQREAWVCAHQFDKDGKEVACPAKRRDVALAFGNDFIVDDFGVVQKRGCPKI